MAAVDFAALVQSLKITTEEAALISIVREVETACIVLLQAGNPLSEQSVAFERDTVGLLVGHLVSKHFATEEGTRVAARTVLTLVDLCLRNMPPDSKAASQSLRRLLDPKRPIYGHDRAWHSALAKEFEDHVLLQSPQAWAQLPEGQRASRILKVVVEHFGRSNGWTTITARMGGSFEVAADLLSLTNALLASDNRNSYLPVGRAADVSARIATARVEALGRMPAESLMRHSYSDLAAHLSLVQEVLASHVAPADAAAHTEDALLDCALGCLTSPVPGARAHGLRILMGFTAALEAGRMLAATRDGFAGWLAAHDLIPAMFGVRADPDFIHAAVPLFCVLSAWSLLSESDALTLWTALRDESAVTADAVLSLLQAAAHTLPASLFALAGELLALPASRRSPRMVSVAEALLVQQSDYQDALLGMVVATALESDAAVSTEAVETAIRAIGTLFATVPSLASKRKGVAQSAVDVLRSRRAGASSLLVLQAVLTGGVQGAMPDPALGGWLLASFPIVDIICAELAAYVTASKALLGKVPACGSAGLSMLAGRRVHQVELRTRLNALKLLVLPYAALTIEQLHLLFRSLVLSAVCAADSHELYSWLQDGLTPDAPLLFDGAVAAEVVRLIADSLDSVTLLATGLDCLERYVRAEHVRNGFARWANAGIPPPRGVVTYDEAGYSVCGPRPTAPAAAAAGEAAGQADWTLIVPDPAQLNLNVLWRALAAAPAGSEVAIRAVAVLFELYESAESGLPAAAAAILGECVSILEHGRLTGQSHRVAAALTMVEAAVARWTAPPVNGAALLSASPAAMTALRGLMTTGLAAGAGQSDATASRVYELLRRVPFDAGAMGVVAQAQQWDAMFFYRGPLNVLYTASLMRAHLADCTAEAAAAWVAAAMAGGGMAVLAATLEAALAEVRAAPASKGAWAAVVAMAELIGGLTAGGLAVTGALAAPAAVSASRGAALPFVADCNAAVKAALARTAPTYLAALSTAPAADSAAMSGIARSLAAVAVAAVIAPAEVELAPTVLPTVLSLLAALVVQTPALASAVWGLADELAVFLTTLLVAAPAPARAAAMPLLYWMIAQPPMAALLGQCAAALFTYAGSLTPPARDTSDVFAFLGAAIEAAAVCGGPLPLPAAAVWAQCARVFAAGAETDRDDDPNAVLRGHIELAHAVAAAFPADSADAAAVAAGAAAARSVVSVVGDAAAENVSPTGAPRTVSMAAARLLLALPSQGPGLVAAGPDAVVRRGHVLTVHSAESGEVTVLRALAGAARVVVAQSMLAVFVVEGNSARAFRQDTGRLFAEVSVDAPIETLLVAPAEAEGGDVRPAIIAVTRTAIRSFAFNVQTGAVTAMATVPLGAAAGGASADAAAPTAATAEPATVVAVVDGRRLLHSVALPAGGALVELDFRAGTASAPVVIHKQAVRCLAVSADGTMVASVSNGARLLRVRRIAELSVHLAEMRLSSAGPVRGVAFSRSGSKVLVTMAAAVEVFDVAPDARWRISIVASLGQPIAVRTVAVGPADVLLWATDEQMCVAGERDVVRLHAVLH